MPSEEARSTPAATTRGRIVLVYILYFIGLGISLPFLPVSMKRLGMGGDAIGLAMAASLVVQLGTPPIWGYLADARAAGPRVLSLAGIAGVLGMGGAAVLPGRLGFVAGYFVFVFARTSIGPILDATALAHPEIGTPGYGQVRRWGSLGFIAGALLAGSMVDSLTARGVPALVALVWLLLTVALARLAGAPPALAGRRKRDFQAFYGRPAVWAFLAVSALHYACGIPFETYFANYAADLGMGSAWTGGAWAGGVLLEVAVLSGLGGLIERLGPRKLLLISFSAGVVRWSLTATLTAPAALAAVQVLHGLTFGAYLGASVVWMNMLVPRELRNSAQSIFAAVSWGAGGIVGQLASGPVYQRLGGRALFAAAACVQLLPLAAMVVMKDPRRTESR